MDVVLTAPAAVALLPLFLALAIGIKLDSPGPVFYRQVRVGRYGKPFRVWKFRSMVWHEADPGPKITVAGDARITPFGQFLRKYKLDELPQLFNVLRGEMSIVGPRPCMPYEFELHKPWQRRRYNAVPGLTGLWQVSGKNRTTFDQMVQLDIKYGERLNLWLDLKIIAKTFPTLWKQCLEARAAKRNQTGAFSDRTE